VLASAVNAWLVPGLVFVLVIVASWLGLRWVRSEHLDALASVPLFSHLSQKRLLRVLDSTQKVEFAAGEVIVTEGERGKGFFVIERGTATVTVDGIERATLAPGAYFGEVAVIDGGPRTATVTAATRVSTLEISPAAFRKVLDDEPSISGPIAEELTSKLERARGGATVRGESASADPTVLKELCRQLRAIEHPDWVQGAAAPRRGLQRMFART
jgi:CRP/FNR family transcriptional regulator, cyclic AMP receptor protein